MTIMLVTKLQIEQVKNTLSSEIVGLLSVYFFGSGITEDFTDTSDVDIAILAKYESPIDAIHLWEVRHLLADILNREVDLVDLRKANTVFQAEIISTGLRVYCSEEYTVEFFETMVYSMYGELNKNRREILETIQKDKRVYE